MGIFKKSTETTAETVLNEEKENMQAIDETAAEDEKTEELKPYKFRKLDVDDVFLMFTIISKIGIKEFKACFEDKKVGLTISKMFSSESKEEAGAIYSVAAVVLLPIADIVIGNLGKCKEDILNLLAQTSDLEVEQIRADAILFTEMVIDFFKKPEFPDFMKVVSKLFK